MVPYRVNGEIMVSGESIDFSDLAYGLGIEPSRVLRREDCKVKEYACDVFIIETDYLDSLGIEDQAQMLIKLVDPKKDILKEYCSTHNLKLTLKFVVQSPDDSWPEMILSEQTVEFAAHFSAEIHFSLYGCLNVDLEDYIR